MRRLGGVKGDSLFCERDARQKEEVSYDSLGVTNLRVRRDFLRVAVFL